MDATELRKLADLEERHWWYAERRHLLKSAVTPLTPGRALDVGAAAGGNTSVLTKLGWDTVAVELSAAGAALGQERGVRIARASATQLPFPNESFDLVMAMDIWEHIDDHWTAASEAHRVLRPGGKVFVTVPCDMALWSAHDVAVGHVRRYGRAQLLDLVAGAGFAVEKIMSWNVLLRPVVAWRRAKSSEGSDLDAVPFPVNVALRGIVATERLLPMGKLPGVSLVALATRLN